MNIVRYAIAGTVAAVIDFAIFAVFAKFLGWNYLWVATAGFSVATSVNYFLSIKLVFNSGVRFTKHAEFAMVFLVSLIGLAVNQLVLFVAVEAFDVGLLISKTLATASVFLWNFGVRDLYVFSPVREL